MNDCVLLLADGSLFPGRSFGAPAATVDDICDDRNAAGRLRDVGEVVFNTAMTGYVEVLTDPSYTGQMVAMTYPHIGNYGVSEEWYETGPEGPTGRSPIKPAGFIVRELYDGPLPAGRRDLATVIAENGVPGIQGVDTRKLTLHLRDQGAQNGVILAVSDGALSKDQMDSSISFLRFFPPMEGRGLISGVGATEEIHIPGDGPHLALFDCGTKANIVRELTKRGAAVTVFPSGTDADVIRGAAADAVLLSNGPGDPAVLERQVATAANLAGEMPLLGICLGHQLIAEAVGGATFKMPFGHHGVNHPVRDERTRKVYITSQNHGFAVSEESLPAGLEVWFRNANDGTVEGLRDDKRRIATAQFHPEAAPGPTDVSWIFDTFLEIARA